jgi:S1-C subfamily serine protease
MLDGMRTALLLLAVLLPTVPLRGQEPADAVDDDALLGRIEAACAALRDHLSLRPVATLREGADGRRCALALAPQQIAPLPPEALHDRLLRSTVIVGHYYRCEECEEWHFSACTGFVVGADGAIATCYHLLEDDPSMPGALLAVADWQGQAYAVTEVLAADRDADVAILACTAKDLEPLALCDALPRAGQRVWCLSNPDHQFATFSEGMVARRYRVHGVAPGTEHEPRTASAPARAQTMLAVSCEFAVGSSGAPVVDARGNVVGIAQSTSTVFVDPDAELAETQMVSRTAVPAAALRGLVRE